MPSRTFSHATFHELEPPFPALIGESEDRIVSLGERAYGHHDSGLCQLAVEWAGGIIRVRYRPRGTIADQLPGRFRQVDPIRQARFQTQEVRLGRVEMFLPPSPTILDEAVIGLGVAIRARHRLHDPGGGQLAERLQRAVGDRHPVAFDAEPEHGDGRFGQGERLGMATLLDGGYFTRKPDSVERLPPAPRDYDEPDLRDHHRPSV